MSNEGGTQDAVAVTRKDAVAVTRKEYVRLLKHLLPKNLDASPDDLLARLDAAHAEFHRALAADGQRSIYGPGVSHD